MIALTKTQKLEGPPTDKIMEATDYLSNLDLDSAFQVEEILLGMGKYVEPRKIRHVIHPREIFSYVGSYETLFRYKLEDPDVSKDEYIEALKQIKSLDVMVDEAEDDKKELLTKARNTFRHAGQRLKYLERGERGPGTKIKQLKQRKEQKLDKSNQYRGMWEGISDGSVTLSVAAVTWLLTKEALASVATGGVSLGGRFGKYLVNIAYDKKDKGIHDYYDPKIKDWFKVLKFERHKVITQTLAEYTNTLGEVIPGSVIDAELT